jgi:hypothetical protein
MAPSQFTLASMFRCQALDEEGFSCVLRPSHASRHRWNRCDSKDPDGHRCTLPFDHTGGHELPWYDSPAGPGQTHTIRYSGSAPDTEALVDATTRMTSRYGWVRRSQAFRLGFLWRSHPVDDWLSRIAEPQGRRTVVFEYRPPDAGEDSNPD